MPGRKTFYDVTFTCLFLWMMHMCFYYENVKRNEMQESGVTVAVSCSAQAVPTLLCLSATRALLNSRFDLVASLLFRTMN